MLKAARLHNGKIPIRAARKEWTGKVLIAKVRKVNSDRQMAKRMALSHCEYVARQRSFHGFDNKHPVGLLGGRIVSRDTHALMMHMRTSRTTCEANHGIAFRLPWASRSTRGRLIIA
jgi:hypothetical protein